MKKCEIRGCVTVSYTHLVMPREGFLEITIGNIVKYIPFSIIPETEAFPVDEDEMCIRDRRGTGRQLYRQTGTDGNGLPDKGYQ